MCVSEKILNLRIFYGEYTFENYTSTLLYAWCHFILLIILIPINNTVYTNEDYDDVVKNVYVKKSYIYEYFVYENDSGLSFSTNFFK